MKTRLLVIARILPERLVRSLVCSFLFISTFLPIGIAQAQDILATVAPNSNGSDTYVDIPITIPTGSFLYFFTDPAPSAARMARVAGGSEFTWPSIGNFAADPNFSYNRLQRGNFLRVYPKTLAAGTEIQVEFSYTQLGPRYHFRVSVVAGARIDSISLLDPLQSTTSLVHWGVTFDQPISDVTAANFALDPTIPGAAIISVTPNTAQPSANWTVTASTGTTMGSIGLKWVGHRTETPSVPNMYTTQFSYLFGDSIFFVQDLPIPPIFVLPNTTTTLTVVAIRRSGHELFYRWYVTAPGNTTPVAIAGATSASYTPPAHASGTYTYFCSVFGSPGQEFTNFVHSQTATVTIRNAPTVNSPFFNSVTSSSAHLGGQVEADNGFAITRRGVLYAPTLVNPNPTLGGTGVIENDDEANSVGGFTRTVTGLSAATNYSFAVFAVNSQGTNYSQVLTFQTNPPVGGGSLIVTTTVDEDNGTSDSGVGAGTSLREAVAYANALSGNQTITFSPNLTAQGPASIQLTQSLGTITLANLSGTTTIAGPGANLLTIQGANGNRIFLATEAGGSARLDGLTLSNASDTNRDGGVIQNGGILYANDCVFSNNSASRGGAIYNGGTSYLSRCTFANNSAAAAANFGGGGAISNEGIVWAMNCTFSGNSAGAGGAIYNVFNSSRVYLICSTLAGNSASTAGGGVFMTAGVTITANNSIISGNTAPSGANVSAPIFQTNSLIDADPAAIFTTGLPANNGGTTPTIALKPGGLAVNAGTNSLAVDYSSAPFTTDSRGKPRIIDGTVDLGAYEMPALPALGASTATNITATSAILGGNVTGDGYGNISKRGVVYALTSQNANPTLGAPGVTEVDASGTTGNFTVPVSGLTALVGYSFTSFVTNEAGTVYAPVQTFQTTESPSLVVTTVTDVMNEIDGLTSLGEAVQYANSLSGPQTVTFAPALAGQTLAVTQGELVVTGNVTFDGSAVAGLTISGNGSTRILRISPGGIAVVKSLTLANGSSSAHGGAIYHSGASLTLQNSTFRDNQAVGSAYGGAISADSGSLSITGCTFSNNQSTEGNGGAIVNFGTQLTIINSTFSGNGALNGGAILSYANTTTLTNCSIVNNSASFTGGGVERVGRTGNTVSLQNTLVAANTAPQFGPDLASYNNQNNGAFTTLGNNLIGNGAGSIGLTNGNNGDQVGTGAAPINANVGVLQDNGGPTQTVALLSGSPAFDAGVAIVGLTTDQRGIGRPQGAAPDIGAFEARVTAAPTFTVTNLTRNISDPAFDLAAASGASPAGGNFSGPAVTGSSFDPAAAGTGVHTITYGVASVDGIVASATFTVTVNQPATITSGDSATFTVGTNGNLQLSASGFPATYTFSNTGPALPSGVTLSPGGVLSGTPADGTGGVYNLTFKVSNGIVPDGTQSFALTVNEAPDFTSAANKSFTVGTAGTTHQLTASGFPTTFTFTNSGAALPSGLSLSSVGLLSGTPDAGTGGVYHLTFQASNGIDPASSQSFTLTVSQPLAFTSADATTFTAGTAGSFNVTASGFPAPTFSTSSPLPNGVSLSATGVLGGTPMPGTGGVYSLTITASNGGTDTTQSFTLTVNQAPAVTSASSATFTVGNTGSFKVEAAGFPTPSLSESGALPMGVTFTPGTGILGGTPAAGTAGSYPLTFTATNGVGSDAAQTFTLTINDAVCVAPPADLVTWYPGEGDATDVKGGIHGTSLDGAGFAAGKAGQGFSFNGSTAIVQMPDNDAWDFGANSFTLETWVKFNAVSGSDVLAAHSEGTGSVNKWIFWLHNGALEFHLNGSAVANITSDAAFAPVIGQWHHVAVTRSGNIYRFYVDGVQNGADRFDSNSVPNATAPLTFGKAEAIPALNGMLDEVKIFSRALTTTEIQSVYNASIEGFCADTLETSSAVSRKTHGAVGDFDVPLPLTGEPGVECRSGGANGEHTIVVTFNNVVTGGTATVNAGSVSGAPEFSLKTMKVNLTGVTNAQSISITLNNVKDGFGQTLSSVVVPMNVLLGDTNASKSVTASDVSQVKALSGSPVDATMFRCDFNTDGTVNASDISQVKAASGTVIP